MATKREKEEASKDPGGARFGNFINYYEFNPPQERVSRLPVGLVNNLRGGAEKVLILDVGCNAGNLTSAVYDQYSSDLYSLHILGVDIDEALISRAVASTSSSSPSSSSYPSFSPSSPRPHLSFACLDIMQDSAQTSIRQYLADHGKDKFNLILVFSVTMWIHLHHGDEGLERFLRLVSGLGDHILLEPQPWKCYQTAARRMRKLGAAPFPMLDVLKLRGDSLEPGILDLCREHELEELERFGETKWNRKLILFKSNRK